MVRKMLQSRFSVIILLLVAILVHSGCGGNGGGGNGGGPPPPKVYRVGNTLPGFNYDEIRFVDGTLVDDRVFVDGRLIRGTITLNLNKEKSIEMKDDTHYKCIANGGCAVDAGAGGKITLGAFIAVKAE